MKFIIGTANFNSKYHIRKKKKINLSLKKKILNTAKRNGINFIDTAPDYSNSEKIIGKMNSSNFKIISKIQKINKKKKMNQSISLVQNIKNTLKNLRTKKIHGLLVHNVQDLLKNKKYYLEAFRSLKDKKLVNYIGVSLYNSEDIFKILKFWKPDIIQIPYNIIDRRIEKKKFINSIKKNKIKLHVRSIFFKGILTDKKNFPSKLKKWKDKVDKWFLWCHENNIQPFEASYLFVKENKLIDNFVISFDDPQQILQLLKIKNLRKLNYPDIKSYDKKFINPYNW